MIGAGAFWGTAALAGFLVLALAVILGNDRLWSKSATPITPADVITITLPNGEVIHGIKAITDQSSLWVEYVLHDGTKGVVRGWSHVTYSPAPAQAEKSP